MLVKLKVNGTEHTWDVAPGATLLDVLREHGYVEVKKGCEEGMCGACTVLLDGVRVNSCLVLAGQAHLREVTTVRGLGTVASPHPIQEAFVEAGAVQCGFCTPGMVLSTHALLRDNPDPPEEEVRRALDGNLCRCTGYVKILDAVRLAAERMRDAGSRDARSGGGR